MQLAFLYMQVDLNQFIKNLKKPSSLFQYTHVSRIHESFSAYCRKNVSHEVICDQLLMEFNTFPY